MMKYGNRKAIKQCLLEQAELKYPGKFTRVSATMFPYIDGIIFKAIEDFVIQTPQEGKTLTAPAEHIED